MLHFFKNRMDQTEKPIKIYNLAISANQKNLSKQDMLLLKSFLHFFPQQEELSCDIQTFRDNVFAHIYCRTSLAEWDHLGTDMIGISMLLSVHDSPEEVVNLLDLSEEEALHSADKELMTEKAIAFINNKRKSFQTACTTQDKIYIDQNSDVNSFRMIWGTADEMNIIYENWG